MEIAGYIASIFIGISLGLIGGGGSVLTVPVLVYLFNIDANLATAYSLFIVGITSVIGSVSYLKHGLINFKTVFVFGLPSIIMVFLTRKYILPSLPSTFFSVGSLNLTKDIFLMLVFAILMIAASYSMVKKEKTTINLQIEPLKLNAILLQGSFTGFITGMLGAGGGFLIIPALVKGLKIPIKTAIGTSLTIISINSLVGFASSTSNFSAHWFFLLTIGFIAILGVLIGSYLSNKIDGKKLQPAFGWFILIIGFFILLKETILK